MCCDDSQNSQGERDCLATLTDHLQHDSQLTGYVTAELYMTTDDLWRPQTT